MSDKLNNINPFPGIRSFETDEDYLFFGREKQITEIVSVLAKTHFLSLIGYSGCGKSSLIRAGVIPGIMKGKIIDDLKGDWVVTVFKPGDDPIHAFAEEIYKCINRSSKESRSNMVTIEEAEQILRSGNQSIETAYNKISRGSGKKWLVVIDQFEEVFRYRQRANDDETSKQGALAFVNLFLSQINRVNADIPVYFILTMRSDFLDNCTEFPGLTEAINTGHFLVPRMTSQDLRSAIIKPIEICNGQISDMLVDRLINELGDNMNQLPVLQHALMRAWDYWQMDHAGNQPIDVHHYEAIGTITKALSIHAEEVFQELPGPGSRLIAEKLFKALTEISTDKKGTRRPTRFRELMELTETREEELITIIDLFRAPGRAFLMPPYNMPLEHESMIDISHESIMRVWTRLREWVEEETKSAELYLRVTYASKLYQKGKTGLLTNPELELAVKWKEHDKPNAIWAMRYDPAFERAMEYLEYSKREFDFEIAKKESKQKRELSRARKFAIFLGSASLISLLFLVISLNLRFKAESSEKIAVEKSRIAQLEGLKAEKQRKEAISQKRISEQQQQIAEQQKIITEEQKQYAISQQKIALLQKQKADYQKKQAEEAKTAAIKAKDEADIQKQIAVSQKQIADNEREKAEISEKNARRLRMLAIAKSMAIQSLKISKSLNNDLPALLALQAYKFNQANNGPDKDPDIFNALSNIVDKKQIFRGHQDAVRGIALSPEGSEIASCSDDGSVRVWNIDNPANPARILNSNNLKSGFRCIDFSPGGKLLVAGNVSGDILMWDLTQNTPLPMVFKGHTNIVNKVLFDRTGNAFVSVSSDGTMKIWNINTPAAPVYSNKSDAKLISLVIGNDNKKIVCGADNGMIKVYDLSKPMEKPMEIQTDGNPVKALAIDRTDQVLAVGNSRGIIRMYTTENFTSKPVELIGHASGITGIRFSPDGKTIASSSYDRTIRLWNYEDQKIQPIIIEDNDSWVMDLTFSRDGDMIFAGSNDKTLRQWTISTNMLADQICGKVNRNIFPEEWSKYVSNDIEPVKTCLNY